MKAFLVFLAMAAAGAAAAQDISFSTDATEACLNDAQGSDRLACIGASANACMQTPAGGSTVGTGYCLGGELGFWDARLNEAYGALRRVEQAMLDEMVAIGANVPDTVKALREMQRAWMGFRDAACMYEYSTWGGGTGGGPANTACLMNLTAQQSFMLDDRLEERMR